MAFGDNQDEQDVIRSCAELQGEEWEVLESIYPDFLSNTAKDGVVKLEIPVELPEEMTIIPAGIDGHLPSPALGSFPSLAVLPPLLLDLFLSPTYPIHEPPRILSLHTTYSWLPFKLSQALRDLLQKQWVAGEGSLYSWVTLIQSGDFLQLLGLFETIGSCRVIQIPHPTFPLLPSILITYDTTFRLTQFSQNSFACEICLTSVKGARCVLLSCSHVFCRSCLEDFWKLCIKEGSVDRVTCPDTQCIKEKRKVTEDELRKVVSELEVKRWKWLIRKRELEKDPTMVHCPLCETPVVVNEATPETRVVFELLRTCPSCEYSFCAYCKHGWHGPVSECIMTVTDSFIREYMATEEGSPEQLLFHQRYGEDNLRSIIRQLRDQELIKMKRIYDEETASADFVSQHTKRCPGEWCKAPIQKIEGCNHMSCYRCHQHFCYLCGGTLDGNNPYSHFSDTNSTCFEKLWD